MAGVRAAGAGSRPVRSAGWYGQGGAPGGRAAPVKSRAPLRGIPDRCPGPRPGRQYAQTTGPSWTAGPAARNTAPTRSSSQPHKTVKGPNRPHALTWRRPRRTQRGGSLLLDGAGQRDVAEGGGVGLSGVGAPAEDADEGLPGGLAGGDQEENGGKPSWSEVTDPARVDAADAADLGHGEQQGAAGASADDGPLISSATSAGFPAAPRARSVRASSGGTPNASVTMSVTASWSSGASVIRAAPFFCSRPNRYSAAGWSVLDRASSHATRCRRRPRGNARRAASVAGPVQVVEAHRDRSRRSTQFEAADRSWQGSCRYSGLLLRAWTRSG